MKQLVYINSVGSVSAQKTADNNSFLDAITPYFASELTVVDPDYKEYIPAATARRMAKGIKMSTVSAHTALKEAGLENVDAIIVGTGLGCLDDSAKFVADIINNNEAFLTPTRFIQSSHNTVAGQIALSLGCKGYNFTYVNSTISFESSLFDALLQLENDEARTILVGGVDELVDHHVRSHRLIGHFKNAPVHTFELLASNTPGAIMGEGAHFFVLSTQIQKESYARLVAVDLMNVVEETRLPSAVISFLEKNNSSIAEIDLVIMGNNGDASFDGYFNNLAATLFHAIPQAYYKHLSGEYDTASAFGFWLANKIIKTQYVPQEVKLNALATTEINTILLYNQYRGENHSLVLLRKC